MRLVSFDVKRRAALRRAGFWKDYLVAGHRNDLVGESGKLAFFMVLASLPFALLVFTVISLLPTEGMETVLVDTLARLVPRPAVPVLKQNLVNTLSTNAGATVWVGALGSILIAARGVAVFETNINRARGTTDERSYLRAWFERIVISAVLGMLMSAAPLILLSGWRITEFLASQLHTPQLTLTLWHVTRYAVVILMVTLAASVLYAVGTANDRPWRWFTAGTLMATAGWLSGSLIFKALLGRFRDYNVIYGSLGSIFITITWIYMSCLFFIAGAGLDGSLDKAVNGETAPTPAAIA